MNTSTSLPALHDPKTRTRVYSTSNLDSGTSTPPPHRPGSLSHSTSSPQLARYGGNKGTYDSPNSASKANGSGAGGKNYHPYLIQSTSSSLLTRSNSSPAQPIHALGGHRTSRSLSSFEYVGGLSGDESDKNGSMGSPSPLTGVAGRGKGMVRSGRSGTLPSFLEEGKEKSPVRGYELPVSDEYSSSK